MNERGLGRGVFFVIDGTDRLAGEDQERFFVRDIHQLRLVESSFVYCAPIDLLTEEGQLRQNFARDLLRLLNYSFQDMSGEIFDRAAAESAVRRLATDYKRLLEPEDYRLLAQIDLAAADYTPVTEQTRLLLYNLALLEYNSFWWQSHPVVRTLTGYVEARAALADGA